MDLTDRESRITSIDNDTQYRPHKIERVQPPIPQRDDETSVSILLDDGWSIYVEIPSGMQTPAVGETARLYGRGLGLPVRGIAIGDRVYRYRTPTEEKIAFEARIAAQRAQKEKAWEDGREQWGKDMAALPAPLRHRIARFTLKPGWGAEFGAYEMFCCKEAVKIADALKTSDAITAFRDAAKTDEQQKLVPTLAYDEHSGNTLGSACSLASALVDRPEIVDKLHGALCPLVGCDNYGCYSTQRRHAIEQARGLVDQAANAASSVWHWQAQEKIRDIETTLEQIARRIRKLYREDE